MLLLKKFLNKLKIFLLVLPFIILGKTMYICYVSGNFSTVFMFTTYIHNIPFVDLFGDINLVLFGGIGACLGRALCEIAFPQKIPVEGKIILAMNPSNPSNSVSPYNPDDIGYQNLPEVVNHENIKKLQELTEKNNKIISILNDNTIGGKDKVSRIEVLDESSTDSGTKDALSNLETQTKIRKMILDSNDTTEEKLKMLDNINETNLSPHAKRHIEKRLVNYNSEQSGMVNSTSNNDLGGGPSKNIPRFATNPEFDTRKESFLLLKKLVSNCGIKLVKK